MLSFWRVKTFLYSLLSVGFVALMLFSLAVQNFSRFPENKGDRTFYLHSASSQGLRVEKVSIENLFRVRGETVRLQYQGTETDLVEEIMSQYHAKVLVIERVGDVVSYYAYTPAWADCVYVGGHKINLHLAINEKSSRCAMGSPIIFDGY